MKVIDLNYGLTNSNFKIALDLDYPNQNNLYNQLNNNQIHEPPMVETIVECVEPNKIFIDVGCHVGYFSLFARQKIGPHGYIYCFEPNPYSYKILVNNIALNNYSNIFCFNCAVSNKLCVSNLNIIEYDEGLSTLCNVDDLEKCEAKHMYENKTNIDVITDKLDDIIINNIEDITLLKIDVEGYEEQVISGAMQLINKALPKNIIFEVNKSVPNQNSNQLASILSLLEPLGYVPYIIHPWPATQDTMKYFNGKKYLPLLNFSNNQNIIYANILMKNSIKLP